jgi:tetratricopeptide (TPR) repeat protein
VEVALREGQGEAAREQAEHLLELRPGDALATGLLGLACKLAADDERALRELTAAARALPMASSLHAALGELHRRARRHAESARSYRRALELDDGVASWWYDLARAEAQSQQAEAGSRAIDRALALAGDGAPTEYWRTKAALLDELGRELEAIPLLQRLTQLQPSVRSYYSLGRVYDELCRLAEARDAYEAARTLEPRHVATLVSLANLYSGSNRTSCARCAAAFAADPGLLDPQAAERCALDYLRADRARLEHVVHFAGYLRRVDRTEGFRAELESELRRATSDEVLGRLLRAQRELAESRAEGR